MLAKQGSIPPVIINEPSFINYELHVSGIISPTHDTLWYFNIAIENGHL